MTIFRKNLILPAEHGSWPWLLVPFVVGVGVSGRVNLAVWLTLLGGLAAFLVRQPATFWLRARAGRGRAADIPLAFGWTIGLSLVGLLCLAGLLALGRQALLLLLAPLTLILALYLLAAYRRRADIRALGVELAGAVGLAAMAPAGYIAATGKLDQVAWGLWLLLAAQNGLGMLYVRLRIADTHGRPMSRPGVWLAHLLMLIVIGWLGAIGYLPRPAVWPFVGYWLRAVWAVWRSRPVTNIKRFGFLEMAIEILAGLWFIATTNP